MISWEYSSSEVWGKWKAKTGPIWNTKRSPVRGDWPYNYSDNTDNQDFYFSMKVESSNHMGTFYWFPKLDCGYWRTDLEFDGVSHMNILASMGGKGCLTATYSGAGKSLEIYKRVNENIFTLSIVTMGLNICNGEKMLDGILELARYVDSVEMLSRSGSKQDDIEDTMAEENVEINEMGKESCGRLDKSDKFDKSGKSDKFDKPGKSGKPDKFDKPDKSGKSDKIGKSDEFGICHNEDTKDYLDVDSDSTFSPGDKRKIQEVTCIQDILGLSNIKKFKCSEISDPLNLELGQESYPRIDEQDPIQPPHPENNNPDPVLKVSKSNISRYRSNASKDVTIFEPKSIHDGMTMGLLDKGSRNMNYRLPSNVEKVIYDKFCIDNSRDNVPNFKYRRWPYKCDKSMIKFRHYGYACSCKDNIVTFGKLMHYKTDGLGIVVLYQHGVEKAVYCIIYRNGEVIGSVEVSSNGVGWTWGDEMNYKLRKCEVGEYRDMFDMDRMDSSCWFRNVCSYVD